MKNGEIKSLMREVAPVFRAFVNEALSPLVARIDALEARPPPRDGITADDVQPMIVQSINEAFAEKVGKLELSLEPPPQYDIAELVRTLRAMDPPPEPGKDADPELMRQMVADAVAELPPPLPGKDADNEAIAAALVPEVERAVAENIEATKSDIEASVAEMVAAAISALPEPAPGKDADPDETAAMVKAEVERAVAALPVPQDGKSVTLDDVAPLIDESVSRAVSALPVPKDGVGLADAVIDRAGNLVLTLTDGSTRGLGLVVGKDADRDEIAAMVRDEVAKIPVPKDGLDGVGFDDLDVTLGEDERTIIITAVRGENRKSWELRLPHVIDRGVYRSGTDYAKGDGVTWGGSFWIAQRDTSDKPETSDAWRLSVKRGRDGKEIVREVKPPAPVKSELPKKPNAS